MSVWNDILSIAQRELRIIRNRPLYIIGSVGVFAFCVIFFLTFFQAGLPSDLPIGVVDYDNSSMSRNFTQQLDATQLGSVVGYADFASAREDMMSGKITSIVLIPKGLNEDVQSLRQPQITFYINGLYFVGGALAYKDILTMVNMANGAVQREIFRQKGYHDQQIMGLIQPVRIDTHQIGNAFTNYGYYLTNIFLPGILGMIIMLIIIYSLGAELKYGTSRHLLNMSGHSMTVALTGKLLVWTVLFCTLGALLIWLLYAWMHFPIAGSKWNMLLNMVLFVLASEAIAIFIIGLIPVPRLALSISALYSVMAFTMSGFTLPVEAMPAYIQGVAAIFPLRCYYLFYVQEVIFGSGFAGWWPQVVYMLVFLLLPVTVMMRLKKAYIKQNFPKD